MKKNIFFLFLIPALALGQGNLNYTTLYQGGNRHTDTYSDLLLLPNGNTVACGKKKDSGIRRFGAIVDVVSTNGVRTRQNIYDSPGNDEAVKVLRHQNKTYVVMNYDGVATGRGGCRVLLDSTGGLFSQVKLDTPFAKITAHDAVFIGDTLLVVGVWDDENEPDIFLGRWVVGDTIMTAERISYPGFNALYGVNVYPGGIVAVGQTNGNSVTSSALLVAGISVSQLDTTYWAEDYISSAVRGLDIDISGGIAYVCGYAAQNPRGSNHNGFLGRYNPADGSPGIGVTFGFTQDEQFLSLVVSGSEIAVSGYVSNGAGQEDGYISVWDTALVLLCDTAIGAPGHPERFNAVITSGPDYLTAGALFVSNKSLQASLVQTQGCAPVATSLFGDQGCDTKVYPNPFSDQLHIDICTKEAWRLMSTDGVVVASGEVVPGNEEVSVHDLPAGFYILRLGDDNHKLVKQ